MVTLIRVMPSGKGWWVFFNDDVMHSFVDAGEVFEWLVASGLTPVAVAFKSARAVGCVEMRFE